MNRSPFKAALTATLAMALVTACGDPNPERQMLAAKDFIQKRDFKSAEIKIKAVQQKNPELPEARYLMGSVLLEQQNPTAAEIEFRKALALGYPEIQVVPYLARALLMTDQAQKLVDEFATKHFEGPAANASLQTTLSKAYAVLGKAALAESALTAALAEDSNHSPALVARARYKAMARDMDGALVILDSLTSGETASAEAWKLKGDILLYAKNSPDEALVAYQKAIQSDAKYLPGHAAALTVWMQMKKLDEAGKALDQLKLLAPHSPQTKYLEAQWAFQNKKYPQAQVLTQQLLVLAPNSPRLLQLAGAIELELGALSTAESLLTRASQAAPELLLARRLLIVTYLRAGQSVKAMDALTAMAAAAGKDGLPPELSLLAGEVYLQNGDAARAQAYLARALKLDPTDVGKRTVLAISRLAAGLEDTAFEELSQIAEADTGSTADLALISAFLARKDFAKALVALDKLEAKQPGKAATANLRGRIFLAQRDNAAARLGFEQALLRDPGFFAAAASLATLDLAAGKPDEARKRFEGLLAKQPKNGPVLVALAELAVARGASHDEVAKLLKRGVEANPASTTPRLLLIDFFLRAKDTQRAMFAAQDAVAALPNNPELQDALGRVQQESGDFNQAIATFGKLVTAQPRAAQPHLRLAGAQLASLNRPAAEQSMRRALDIKPDDLQLQRGLIVLLLEAKKFPDAMTVARVAQRQQPDRADGYAMEGDIAAAQKDWTAAAVAYRSGLTRLPSTELAIKLFTVSAVTSPAAADKVAANWLASHPKDAAFMNFLGEMALTRNDFAAAEKNYQAALKIEPDNPGILNNLAWASHRLGKSEAVALAEKANQLAPNQPALMDTLAMVLASRGDHATAIDLQLKALELQKANPALRLNLAKIYVAAGSKVLAKKELDELARLGEKSATYTEVMAMLTAL